MKNLPPKTRKPALGLAFMSAKLIPEVSTVMRGFLSIVLVIFASLPLLAAGPVHACGWWGDGEVSRDDDRPEVTAPDGSPLEQTLSIRSTKLPGRMGYGIAVPGLGRAIPYLLATSGRPVNRIGELKTFGFLSVIDLGTQPKTARLHQTETEAVGMRYFNIPVEGDMPSREQTDRFSRMVYASSRGPLLVYAPSSALLGAMWASYLINLGAPLDYALKEGKSLGMAPEQEDELRRRSR